MISNDSWNSGFGILKQAMTSIESSMDRAIESLNDNSLVKSIQRSPLQSFFKSGVKPEEACPSLTTTAGTTDAEKNQTCSHEPSEQEIMRLSDHSSIGTNAQEEKDMMIGEEGSGPGSSSSSTNVPSDVFLKTELPVAEYDNNERDSTTSHQKLTEKEHVSFLTMTSEPSSSQTSHLASSSLTDTETSERLHLPQKLYETALKGREEIEQLLGPSSQSQHHEKKMLEAMIHKYDQRLIEKEEKLSLLMRQIEESHKKERQNSLLLNHHKQKEWELLNELNRVKLSHCELLKEIQQYKGEKELYDQKLKSFEIVVKKFEFLDLKKEEETKELKETIESLNKLNLQLNGYCEVQKSQINEFKVKLSQSVDLKSFGDLNEKYNKITRELLAEKATFEAKEFQGQRNIELTNSQMAQLKDDNTHITVELEKLQKELEAQQKVFGEKTTKLQCEYERQIANTHNINMMERVKLTKDYELELESAQSSFTKEKSKLEAQIKTLENETSQVQGVITKLRDEIISLESKLKDEKENVVEAIQQKSTLQSNYDSSMQAFEQYRKEKEKESSELIKRLSGWNLLPDLESHRVLQRKIEMLSSQLEMVAKDKRILEVEALKLLESSSRSGVSSMNSSSDVLRPGDTVFVHPPPILMTNKGSVS